MKAIKVMQIVCRTSVEEIAKTSWDIEILHISYACDVDKIQLPHIIIYLRKILDTLSSKNW